VHAADDDGRNLLSGCSRHVLPLRNALAPVLHAEPGFGEHQVTCASAAPSRPWTAAPDSVSTT
jgi:hypothetical protein